MSIPFSKIFLSTADWAIDKFQLQTGIQKISRSLIAKYTQIQGESEIALASFNLQRKSFNGLNLFLVSLIAFKFFSMISTFSFIFLTCASFCTRRALQRNFSSIDARVRNRDFQLTQYILNRSENGILHEVMSIDMWMDLKKSDEELEMEIQQRTDLFSKLKMR